MDEVIGYEKYDIIRQIHDTAMDYDVLTFVGARRFFTDDAEYAVAPEASPTSSHIVKLSNAATNTERFILTGFKTLEHLSLQIEDTEYISMIGWSQSHGKVMLCLFNMLNDTWSYVNFIVNGFDYGALYTESGWYWGFASDTLTRSGYLFIKSLSADGESNSWPDGREVFAYNAFSNTFTRHYMDPSAPRLRDDGYVSRSSGRNNIRYNGKAGLMMLTSFASKLSTIPSGGGTPDVIFVDTSFTIAWCGDSIELQVVPISVPMHDVPLFYDGNLRINEAAFDSNTGVVYLAGETSNAVMVSTTSRRYTVSFLISVNINTHEQNTIDYGNVGQSLVGFTYQPVDWMPRQFFNSSLDPVGLRSYRTNINIGEQIGLLVFNSATYKDMTYLDLSSDDNVWHNVTLPTGARNMSIFFVPNIDGDRIDYVRAYVSYGPSLSLATLVWGDGSEFQLSAYVDESGAEYSSWWWSVNTSVNPYDNSTVILENITYPIITWVSAGIGMDQSIGYIL